MIGKLKLSHLHTWHQNEALWLQRQLENNLMTWDELVQHPLNVCRVTKDRNGDLGWVGRNEIFESIEKVAFELEIGEMTKNPILSEIGWHILKRTA